ncbi:ABC transporter ATP-binding protein [Dactylosporangium salmoneum]|uniref:ABC transporter ATP-binding protein n=1 Tax=Dactylosporangium salmoneum TaxID=53361 RepID=A0ABN3GR91_9ACTN
MSEPVMTTTTTKTTTQSTLEVENLCVEFRTDAGWRRVVDGVSFSVAPGETLGLVGESGSGKTVTCMSIPRLLPRQARIAAGSIRLAGRDLLALPESQMQEVRGRDIGVVFQEPSASLNPAFTVGDQIMAVIRRHERIGRRQARQRAIELLRQVGIPRADLRVDAYPHEFSGGMAQRAMIAMAIACSPALLLADEPTTALDVTIQAQIIDLFRSLQDELGMAMIVVSHDLAMVGELAHRINVMYSAEVVETGTRSQVLGEPRHPYTEGLLSAMPHLTTDQGRLNVIPGTARVAGDEATGCRFAPRCSYAAEQCTAADIPLTYAQGTHAQRCVRADELSLRGWV